MRGKNDDPDRFEVRQKKGTWLRFIKMFPKCHLPWLWLAAYIILSLGIVDIGINETDYTAQLFAGDTSAGLMFRLIAVMIINMLGSSLLVFVGAVTSARINRNMRGVVLNKVIHLPMSWFKDENPREAIYRIVNNSIMIDSTIMLVILPIVTAGYTAVKVFSRVFTYDWRLSAVLIAFIPLQIFIAFIFGRLNFSAGQKEMKINASLTEKLAEMITNIPLAKAFAKEERELENGEELTKRLYRVSIKASWLSQFKDMSEAMVSLLQSLVMVITGMVLLRNGELSTRAWISFYMFSSVFCGAVTQLMVYWNNMKIIQGNADRVAEIMNAPEEDRRGALCEGLVGALRMEGVRFGYDEDKPVLNKVSCEFPDNCVTALLGVSGSGKTTLINLLTRLYIPQEGTITAGGRNIQEFALDDYRSQFVVVSQNGMLFSGTVRENVCYGNGTVADDALMKALKQAGAYEFVMNLPKGVETRLEEYGGNLSGGQRQRLAVARALLSEAHYLILDEPAASMDAVAAAELMDILRDVSKGRCVIMIAHTAAVLPLAQRVIILENGTVAAQGKTEEVRKSSSFLRELAGKKVAE